MRRLTFDLFFITISHFLFIYLLVNPNTLNFHLTKLAHSELIKRKIIENEKRRPSTQYQILPEGKTQLENMARERRAMAVSQNQTLLVYILAALFVSYNIKIVLFNVSPNSSATSIPTFQILTRISIFSR